MPNIIDLTGQQFGELTVLEMIPKTSRVTYWKCLCSCGEECIKSTGKLRSGHTKSCGHLKKIFRGNQFVSQADWENRFEVFYDISGEYGIGYTTKKEKFYFDLEDYDKIKQYIWTIDVIGYVATQEKTTRKKILMHRLLMNNPIGLEVDHINHDTKDNRKCNLRVVNKINNSANKRMLDNNKSGHIGVYYNKNVKKWHARIKRNNKSYNLGYYDNIEDAIVARQKAEDELCGEYSYRKSIEKVSKVDDV